MEKLVKEFYIASDGSEFESEEECLQHELTLHPSVKMWGSSKYDPSIPQGLTGIGERVNNLEAAWFIVASEDDAQYIEDMAFYTGVSKEGLDPEGGADAFIWNEAAGEWVKVSDMIEDLTEKLEYYKSIYEKMMEA